jgi:hypothetical protein
MLRLELVEEIILSKFLIPQNRISYLRAWFDCALGHQEASKPPSGGFFIFGNKPLV